MEVHQVRSTFFSLFYFYVDIFYLGTIQWTVMYASTLFDDSIIIGLTKVIFELVHQLAQSQTLIKNFDLVSREQQLQLAAWNLTDGDFPSTKRLNNLFEYAVDHSPSNTAIIDGDTQLSFKELDILANKVAHWLIAPPVQLQLTDLVGLFLDKGHLTVATILAIWKAGAAFVPIDTSYPDDRVCFALHDTKARCLIASSCHRPRLEAMFASHKIHIHIIYLEDVLPDMTSMEGPPVLATNSSQLAYVTYTSGTTGVPKGVPKQHFRVVNSITDLSERYHMTKPGEEKIALFASYVFEPFMRQMLISLINSQTLVIVSDRDRMHPLHFKSIMLEHGITYLNATGSVLQHFDLNQCHKLKKVLLVGEELTSQGLQQLQSIFKGHIINEYGFTESAFVTAIKEFPPTTSTRTNRSLGRPLRNVKCYVLSCNMKQVPIGAIGDLYIGRVVWEIFVVNNIC